VVGDKYFKNKEKVSEVEKYYFTFQPSLHMLLMINCAIAY